WHDTLRTTLAALGFAPSTADLSLFLRTDTLLPPFYILMYVDDLVFATADTAGLAHVKSELQKRHTCTDLGELRSYLGLQITRDKVRRTITLTQSHMVQQVLQRFDFTYSSPQATPLSTHHLLSALPSDESIEPSGPYPELVGCLMYLMTCTRPDLAYPRRILARYVAPGRHQPEHMAAAKRVLRYLVCKLKKSIYGLKQAPRCWYQKLAAVLEEMGFRTSSCDESLLLKGEGEKLVLFLVYVDDILLFSSSMKEIQKVQQQLMKNFKCKTLGEVKYYLGMHVERDLDHRWLKLHQEKFIKELGEKYGIENERKVATPLPAEFKLVKAAED
ncbi:unnamed protein product, partial [Closterium sp. NIES-54]